MKSGEQAAGRIPLLYAGETEMITCKMQFYIGRKAQGGRVEHAPHTHKVRGPGGMCEDDPNITLLSIKSDISMGTLVLQC